MSRQCISPLKLEQWPAADRGRWLIAQKPAGLFDRDSLAASWRPATVANSERGYGIYLAWLASREQLDPNIHPCERVSEEWIRAFLDVYSLGRSERTVAGTIRDIAYVLRACAPPDGVGWLTKLAHRLVNTAKPARDKASRMARPDELLDLADHLMAEGLPDLEVDRHRGVPLYRDGLMMALLAYCPLRRRNLATLRIGHSIVFATGGARICYAGKETKAGRAIDWAVPEVLLPAFDVYLNKVRPIPLRYVDKDEGWLWLGRWGRPMSETSISHRITGLTLQYLGKPVSPHLFRDCAATQIALEDPKHIGITKSVLGHATLASSQKFYNQATSFSAFARYQDVIRKLRNDE